LTQINVETTGRSQFPSAAKEPRMDRHLRAFPMKYADARAAYPLISMHDSNISLAAWLRFARRFCGGAPSKAGLISIRDRRGIVHAIYSYRVLPEMHGGLKLSLGNLVVAQMPGSRVEDAVMNSVDELAARLGCQTVTIEQRFGGLSHPFAAVRGSSPMTRSVLHRGRYHH